MPCIRTFLIDLFFLAKTYNMVDKARAAIAHLFMKQEDIWADVYYEPQLYIWVGHHLRCGDLARDALKQLVGSNSIHGHIPKELCEEVESAHNTLAQLILKLYDNIFETVDDRMDKLCSALRLVRESNEQGPIAAQIGKRLARIMNAELTSLLRTRLRPPYTECNSKGVVPDIPTGFDVLSYSKLRDAAEQADIGILDANFLTQLAEDYDEDINYLRQASVIFLRPLAAVFQASFLFAVCDHQCEHGCTSCWPSEGGPYDYDSDDDDEPGEYIPHCGVHKQTARENFETHTDWSTFQSCRAKYEAADRFTWYDHDLRQVPGRGDEQQECVLDKESGSAKPFISGYSKDEAISEEQRALMSAIMDGQADVYDNSLPQFRPETDAKDLNEHYWRRRRNAWWLPGYKPHFLSPKARLRAVFTDRWLR